MSTHIQRSALLPYSAQMLYKLVNDIANYPVFLPWCSEAKILSSDDTKMTAELTIKKAGIRQSFTTQNILTENKKIEMNLIKGPFNKFQGFWLFADLDESACRISLDLSFDYSGFIVKATLGPLFNEAANKMVDAFCQRAQIVYGKEN